VSAIVIDRTTDGSYAAFDHSGSVRAAYSRTELNDTSFDVAAPERLAAVFRSSLGGALGVVAIDPTIGCGSAVRQNISLEPAFAVVGLGALLIEQTPPSARRFTFVEANGRRLHLIAVDAARAITHVASADFECVTDRELGFAAALGYDFVLSETPLDNALAARTTPLSRTQLHADARALALRKPSSSGVWIARSDAGSTLTMTLEQRISFDVLQTRLPIFDLQNDALADSLGGRRPIFFIDETIDALFGAELRGYATGRLNDPSFETVRASESEKTLESARALCRHARGHGLPRDGVFIAVGGGVTLDLVGTAAALHRRGSDFIRIPTTLVGMIDVCVGVKQGVNDGPHKNALGAYHAPLCGLNDLRFLATLPPSEIAAGLAEIIKVALVLDAEIFTSLESHVASFFSGPFEDSGDLLEIVIRAKYIMMRELQKNLWEKDLRRFVDFGHTFSSAIETESNYAISHGLAVGLDMLVSTALAVNSGLCKESLLARLIALYKRAGLLVRHETCTTGVLLKAIPSMRVHRAGNLNLVVPTGVGSGTFLQNPTPAEVARAVELIDALASELAPT